MPAMPLGSCGRRETWHIKHCRIVIAALFSCCGLTHGFPGAFLASGVLAGRYHCGAEMRAFETADQAAGYPGRPIPAKVRFPLTEIVGSMQN